MTKERPIDLSCLLRICNCLYTVPIVRTTLKHSLRTLAILEDGFCCICRKMQVYCRKGGDEVSEKVKKPYRIATSVYVAVIFSFYLLFFGKNGLAAISKAKMHCYYALTICYAATVIFLFIIQAVQKKLKIEQLKKDLHNTPAAAWLILSYLIFTVISACLSDFDTVWLGGNRHEGVLTISLYCISFLLICRFFRSERWMLYLFAAAATAFGCICILQIFDINIFGLYPIVGDKKSCADYISSFIGTIGNIDFTASFLCIAIPVFWCSILRFKEKMRFLLLIPLLLCLYILLKIRVAAGYVGIFVGTLLSLPVVIPCTAKKRLLLLISVISVFLAAGILIYCIDFQQRDLHDIHEVFHGNFKGRYGSGRIYIWKQTIRAIPDHLWFGNGPDTMSQMAFARLNFFNNNNELVYAKVFDAAHNEYLTTLFHQGIFALMAYLSALTVSIVQWFCQAQTKPAAAIAGTAVLCYSLQAFFGISQLITSPFFWCVFAILVAVLQDKKEQHSS